MEYEDFDVDSLARYMHLTRAQVQRMADRGKLPGRKVAGQWRFPQADIHHWLEDRIGISDESELIEMEEVLDAAPRAAGAAPVSISSKLPIEAIAAPLEANTADSVIRAMTDLAARTGLLWDARKMAEAVRAREKLHPTALECGVALLHPRRPMSSILAQPFLALGRTSRGIAFGGSRGALTDIFFLICSTDDQRHLRTLARLSRLISDPALLTAIREAPEARMVHEAIAQFEEKLPT